eukprot:gnl/TRDRNA2_/TRDRNA2_207211_c0_seq1.p1 gnl/TRDRNA2_/TRDRNA2_207211_c0~~gnl/TRDRNA2_/TRDRNA2_207211_c0_seq1.p1  ORF type:complete len:202 (-),score=7.92 gnl/TRDRNA2_/TRDRNA2_207211_c0_seq1:262-867(-)
MGASASSEGQDDRTYRLLASHHEVLKFTADLAAVHELPLSRPIDRGFTLDFWLCVKEQCTKRDIFGQTPLIVHTGEYRGFRLDVMTRSNKLRFTSLGGGPQLIEHCEASFPLNEYRYQWHRVTATLDVSGEHCVQLYIDGVLCEDKRLRNYNLPSDKHTLLLGADLGSGTNRLIGEMKQLRLHSGVLPLQLLGFEIESNDG